MDFYDEIMMEKILKEMDRFRENGREHMARFEITETSYAAIRENRSGIFESLRIKNAKILLDDFGSGFSSFGMLQDYDFDILKIDMSFIRKIGENPKTKSGFKSKRFEAADKQDLTMPLDVQSTVFYLCLFFRNVLHHLLMQIMYHLHRVLH